jgi:hypothetical protein
MTWSSTGTIDALRPHSYSYFFAFRPGRARPRCCGPRDVWGVSLNWIDAVTAGARPESSVEIFYRFPLYPTLDMSINYMGIIHPSLDPDNDFASAFSLRFATSF